jgi:hypothetical protein
MPLHEPIFFSRFVGFVDFRSFGILNTTKRNFLETGPVSVFRWSEEGTYSVGSLRMSQSKSQRLRLVLSKEPNRVRVSLPSIEAGNRFNFRIVSSSYFEFQMTHKVHIPSEFVCHVSLPEHSRFYQLFLPI